MQLISARYDLSDAATEDTVSDFTSAMRYGSKHLHSVPIMDAHCFPSSHHIFENKKEL